MLIGGGGGCESNLLTLPVRLRGGRGSCSGVRGGTCATDIEVTANADEMESRKEERRRADGRLLGGTDGRLGGNSGEGRRKKERSHMVV